MDLYRHQSETGLRLCVPADGQGAEPHAVRELGRLHGDLYQRQRDAQLHPGGLVSGQPDPGARAHAGRSVFRAAVAVGRAEPGHAGRPVHQRVAEKRRKEPPQRHLHAQFTAQPRLYRHPQHRLQAQYGRQGDPGAGRHRAAIAQRQHGRLAGPEQGTGRGTDAQRAGRRFQLFQGLPVDAGPARGHQRRVRLQLDQGRHRRTGRRAVHHGQEQSRQPGQRRAGPTVLPAGQQLADRRAFRRAADSRRVGRRRTDRLQRSQPVRLAPDPGQPQDGRPGRPGGRYPVQEDQRRRGPVPDRLHLPRQHTQPELRRRQRGAADDRHQDLHEWRFPDRHRLSLQYGLYALVQLQRHRLRRASAGLGRRIFRQAVERDGDAGAENRSRVFQSRHRLRPGPAAGPGLQLRQGTAESRLRADRVRHHRRRDRHLPPV
ncbi:hypothetical protein D3C71_664850 [compost metagenome]